MLLLENSPCKISRKKAEKSEKTCATGIKKTKYSAVISTTSLNDDVIKFIKVKTITLGGGGDYCFFTDNI